VSNTIRAPYISKGCFGCGTENPYSLGLKPRIEGKTLVADLTIPERYRGFSRVVHGGIVTAVLDELMGMVIGSQIEDGRMATVGLQIDFKRPVLVETPITARARYVGVEGRFHQAEGELVDSQGRVLSRGRGRFVPITSEQAQRFMGREFGDGPGD
jgi:uncharacterized protein (TIGR00369 family)